MAGCVEYASNRSVMLRRNGAQKLLGVLITIGEAVAYVVSGMYGDVRELGAGNAVLIILQVCPHCISATHPVLQSPVASFDIISAASA